FGLACWLERTVLRHTPAQLTIAYAAPERFTGQTSRGSDQYSLAVTYCQMRGGRLPFQGREADLMVGHLFTAPDLTMLPEEGRPPVARALAKTPEARWPSCSAFVTALQAGGQAPASLSVPEVSDLMSRDETDITVAEPPRLPPPALPWWRRPPARRRTA